MNDTGSLGSKNEKKMPKTITLVRKLFYRSPGSSGAASFLVTKPVRELSNAAVAEWVAGFNLFLHKVPDQDCFKAYCDQREACRTFLKTRGASEPKKVKQQEQALAQTRSALLKTLEESPDYPSGEQPLKELGHYPIKAFLECADGEYVSTSMPQMILQALLYKKTEGDRAAFRTYYEWLDKRLGCLAHPLPATWEQDIFSSDQRDTLLAEIKTLPEAQAYERAVFMRLSPTDYPPLLSYSDVTLQGAGFTDCMENTIRNVSNFLAYNQQTGLFDCDLLEQRLGTKVHESVKRFYEQYADPAAAAQKGAHNAWATLSATLPNHIYCRALPPISHQKKDCVNVVPETPITTELLAKKGYVSLSSTSVAYDMRPLIKNFMLTSDHLFGLQLFKDLPVDAWAREGFITEQLPRVIAALKARVPATLDIATLEYHDGSMIPAYIPLAFSFKDSTSIASKPYDFTLTLHTEYDDGEVLFNQPPTTTVALPARTALQGDSRSLLSSPREIYNNHSAEEVLAWLFTQDLASNCNRYALTQQVPVFDERILEVLLFSARTHAKGDEQAVQVLRMYQESLQRGLIGCDAVVKTALSEASTALHSKNTLIRGEALQLFTIICAHGKGVDAATACAAACLSSTDKKDISAGLSLLKVLVGQGKALDDADIAVQRVLNSLKPLPTGVRFEAAQLRTQLMQDHGATGVNGVLRRKRSREDSFVYEQLHVEPMKKKLKISTQKWAAFAGLVAALLYVKYKYVKSDTTSAHNVAHSKECVGCDTVYKDKKRELSMKRLAVLVSLCSLSLNASVNTIKDTYTILKPGFRDLSSIHGVVAWESGWLNTLYETNDERKKTATVKLVQKLFHKNVRTAGAADLVTTKDIRHLDEHASIFFVAHMLMLLRNMDKQEAFSDYARFFTLFKQMKAEGKTNISVDGKTKGVRWVQEQVAIKRKELIASIESSDEYKNFAEPFQKLVPAFIEAHLECLTETIFSPTTVQLILLALLYKETGGDKRFMRSYYEFLDEKLSCLDGKLDGAWEASQFTSGSLDSILTILSSEPLTGGFLEKHFEEYVFVRFARLVPLVRYGDAFFKTHEFTDCMDTAVRNMLNLLVYNPETKRFDTSILEQRLGVRVSKELKKFYAEQSDPATISHKEVRNAWAEIVSSNLPFVAYNRALINDVVKELPTGKRGFIRGVGLKGTDLIGVVGENSSARESTVGAEKTIESVVTEKGYVVVPDGADVFTVKPTLKNLIVMLDYLLQLNLFEGNVQQEFLREDFVAVYLPKLAQKLHATVPIVIDADKRDFTEELVATTFDFNFTVPKPYVASVTLLTESRHGVLEFCPAPLTENTLVVPEPLTEPYPLSLSLLVHGAEKKV